MNLRPVIGSLIICLMLQYSISGLYANATFLNDSGVSNNNRIVVPENTTVNTDSGMLNNIVASPDDTTFQNPYLLL